MSWPAGPIRAAQRKLPHLPVCEIAETRAILDPTLACMASSPEELAKTRATFDDFCKTQAPRAHAKLVEFAESCRAQVKEYFAKDEAGLVLADDTGKGHPDGSPYPNNHFLEATWDAMAYLAWQDSIACFSNVFTVMMDAAPLQHDPLLRATWLTLGVFDFGKQLLTNELEADKGMCSAQYLRILWTTRLPGKTSDRIVTRIPTQHGANAAADGGKSGGPFADRAALEGHHIAVTCRGHWYGVPLAWETSPESLYEAFKWIRQDADKRGDAKVPLARLTGDTRDRWADARVRLMASSVDSAASLRVIEEAVFHVVLSEEAPYGSTGIQHALSEGRGVWFDKSTSIVVFKNGTCGANLEHAAADAVVPSRMLVHACDFAAQNDARVVGTARDVFKNAARTKVKKTPWQAGGKTKPSYLAFDLDDQVPAAVERAAKHLESIYADNQVDTVTVPGISFNDVKKLGVASPDSFMQMVLQVAYALDQKTPVPPATYETASTRAFFHGRTECIRTQSPESRAFVEAITRKWGQPRTPKEKEELRALCERAARVHRDYSTKANNGRGGDRHMLMMRMMAAQQLGEKPHPIFEDPLFSRSTVYALSTSQLPWMVYDHPGFGAPYPISYGVCYRGAPDAIVATVTSRPISCKEKNAARFARTIEQVVQEMFEVLKPAAAAAGAKAKL